MPHAKNSNLEEAEKWFNDLEYKVMESNEAEQKKRESRIMKREIDREFSDSIKHNNIYNRSLRRRERKGDKIYLKK